MNTQPSDELPSAAAHFRAGRLGQAETICRQILARQPNMIDTLHLLALIMRQRKDFEEAASLFRACLKMSPNRADIRANYGNLLNAKGDVTGAISEYRGALKSDPDFLPASIALVRALNKTGAHSEAQATSMQLLKKNNDCAEAWAALGAAHRGLDKDAESEAAYRKAIDVDPDYGTAHHNLGALLAQQDRHEEALEQLMVAAKKGVKGPEIAHNLASSLAGLTRFDESEALLVEATQAIPQAIELHRLLARLRFMRGDPEFDASIRTASAAAPDVLGLRVAHAQLLRAATEFDKAFAVLEDLDDATSGDKAVQSELAAIHQETGRYEEALACARAVAAESKEFGDHTDLLIDALMSLGRADEAMPHIELARSTVPLNQFYVAMEATAARLLGDPRYEQFYDYERFIQMYALEAPAGWSSFEDLRHDLNTVLVERHKFQSQPLDQTLRKGTQTPRSLLRDPHPVIVAFLQALLAPIELYRRHIGDDSGHPMTVRNQGDLKMTGCWSVRLGREGYHVNHVHPEGWVSSAYYAEVPAEVSDTERKSGWIKFGEPRFPVPGATAEKYVQPEAGSLVLFPSYMWHGTTPIIGDEPRMTVAFDAICVAR